MRGPDSSADILVVDDTPANLQLLSGMLKERGYKVRPAPSGKLALQAARHRAPDLILLDINMPDLSGLEVAQQLKADPALRDIPVIFLSAMSETSDKLRAFQAGGVDYVTKPFQFDEVEARVSTHLKLRRLQAELEDRSRRLQQSNDELRRLQEFRDSLTSMIVHDMRSPLTAVVGNIDLVAMNDALDPDDAQSLSQARTSASTIISMVTSLLDVSRMEAGELVPRRQPCNLVPLCDRVLGTFETMRGSRQLLVRHASSDATARLDEDLIGRVIQNLVANALRFTPAQGTVTVETFRDGEGVRLSVTDTGIGIAPEHHALIFEKFGQVKGVDRRSGTGLGLTFCKLAVEAHGGRIGVRSALGQGCTFWFEVPDTVES